MNNDALVALWDIEKLREILVNHYLEVVHPCWPWLWGLGATYVDDTPWTTGLVKRRFGWN